MELRKLLKDSLERNGFDGLFNPGVCACKLDDLCPCDEPSILCEGGVLQTGDDDHCENCEGTDKCDFHIGPRSNSNAEAETSERSE